MLTDVCTEYGCLLSTQDVWEEYYFYYHLWELLQVSFLSRQKTCFVATDTCLPRETRVCRDKTFVATKMILVTAPANDRFYTAVENALAERQLLRLPATCSVQCIWEDSVQCGGKYINCMSQSPHWLPVYSNACNEGRSRIESLCLLTADGQSCVRRIQSGGNCSNCTSRSNAYGQPWYNYNYSVRLRAEYCSSNAIQPQIKQRTILASYTQWLMLSEENTALWQ